MHGKRLKLNINKVLERMNEELVKKGEGYIQLVIKLNNHVVDYLRDEKNPDPNWDAYPVARTWFSQHTLRIGGR